MVLHNGGQCVIVVLTLTKIRYQVGKVVDEMIGLGGDSRSVDEVVRDDDDNDDDNNHWNSNMERRRRRSKPCKR